MWLDKQRRIEALEPRHVYAMEYRQGDEFAIDNLIAMLRMDKSSYRSWVLYDGDVMAAIGGICMLWPGVGEGFLCVPENIMRVHSPVTRLIHRIMKYLIPGWMVDLKIHRLQIATDIRYPARSQWARRLGFQIEGYMPKYGADGGDYLRWSITREIGTEV